MDIVLAALYGKINSDTDITEELGLDGKILKEYPAIEAHVPSIIVSCSDEGGNDGYSPKANEMYQIDIRAKTRAQRDRITELITEMFTITQGRITPLLEIDGRSVMMCMVVSSAPAWQPTPLDVFRKTLTLNIITVPLSV